MKEIVLVCLLVLFTLTCSNCSQSTSASTVPSIFVYVGQDTLASFNVLKVSDLLTGILEKKATMDTTGAAIALTAQSNLKTLYAFSSEFVSGDWHTNSYQFSTAADTGATTEIATHISDTGVNKP